MVRGETTEELFRILSTKPYLDSCILVHKLKQKESFPYHSNIHKFAGEGIVVNDLKKKLVKQFPDFDIYNDGVIHGKCTLVNALHIAWHMKYSRIIFVGIDLYDSRYFWLKPNVTRQSVKNKKRIFSSRHSIAKMVISVVKDFKNIYPDIKLYTYNPKSLLRKVVPIWEK